MLLDVNGDGLPDIVQAEESQPNLQLYVNQGKAVNKLKTITNGIGSSVSIEYGTVTATVDSCHFPEACGRKVQVVSAYEKDNGTGGETQSRNRFTLEYQHPVTDVLGRGWQGFQVKTETNQQTGQKRTLTFNLTRVNGFYPFAGMVESETIDTPLTSTGGAVRKIRQVQEFLPIFGNPNAGPPFAIRPHKIAEFEFNADVMPSSWDSITPTVSRATTNEYDAFGNLRSTTVSSSNAFRQNLATDSTEYTYAQDTDAWLIAQPRSMKSNSTGPNGETGLPRFRTYETYTTSGLVHFTHVEPLAGNADERLDVETVIDQLGNVRKSIATDMLGNVRSQSIDYDDLDATVPSTIKNALGQPTTLTYHQGLGVLVQRTEPNGANASWEYDGLGRVRQEQTTAGPATQLHYLRTIGDQGYTLNWLKTGGGSGSTTYDSLGRPAIASDVGFDSVVRYAVTTYDRNSGNVASQSLPRTATGSSGSVTTDYDEVGRPIKVSPPGQDSLFVRYKDLAKTVYQGPTFATSVTRAIDLRDEWGRTTSSQNVLEEVQLSPGRSGLASARSTITDFDFGPYGLLKHIYNRGDAQVVTTEDQYDRIGRRLVLIDPDGGNRQTRYNAFGDVRLETDAMGVDTTYDPDPLGRPNSITRAGVTDTFIWDSSPGGGMSALGQLGSAVSSSGVGSENYYDSIGRLHDQTTSIEGASYTFHFDYDPTTFNLTQLSYPAVTADGRVTLNYTYNGNDGLLSQLDMTHSDLPVWKKTTLSDGGQVSVESLGNGETAVHDYDDLTGRMMHIAAGSGAILPAPSGYHEPGAAVQSLTYSYDSRGRIHTKTDWKLGSGEIYNHDNLDRLAGWTSADGSHSVSYDYSDLGNLKAHRETTNGVEVDEIYRYGENGAGPHAVTGGPLGELYGYDANGRQTSRPGQPVLVYNRFDLPDSIQHGSTVTLFKYDALGTRAAKATGTDSTLYVGGLYERRQTATGVAHVFYVPGIRGVIAQLSCDGQDGAATCGLFKYFHQDRLDTIDTISQESGPPIHVACDPYGRALNTTGDVHVGFTGEEQDDELGLVNLNHRLYDPKLGRFVSPDLVIGAPFSAQGHNRYAYALNSPALLTDRRGLDSAPPAPGTGTTSSTDPGRSTQPTTVTVEGPLGGENGGGAPNPADLPPPMASGPPDLSPDGQNPNTSMTVTPDRTGDGGGGVFGLAPLIYTFSQIPGLPLSIYDRPGHDGETVDMLAEHPGVAVAGVAAAALTLGGLAALPWLTLHVPELAMAGAAAGGAAATVGRTATSPGGRLLLETSQAVLSRWFGGSVVGAQSLLAEMQFFKGQLILPAELTRDMLLWNRGVAMNAIAVGRDTLGVQAMRLQIIEAALALMNSR